MRRRAHDPLLLVGFRRGVLRALEALGHPALLVLGRDRPVPEHPSIAGACEVDLHGPLAPVEEAVRALLAGRRPAAVVALAERTVVVAAHLRAALGLQGNAPATALACADKVVMKRTMDAAGIPVAPWRELDRGTTAGELVDRLGLPLVIKPRRDSGGRGQRRLAERAAVERTLAELARGTAFEKGFGWLAEGWIEGEEMSVETFVRDGQPVFSNPTEYYVPRHANILPSALPADAWGEARRFAERALAAAGVRTGITHLELFRTPRGPILGELASRPPGGRLMQLLRRAWDFDPWEALLRLELGEVVPFPELPRRTAGVWILHPGPGVVTAVHGLDEARAVPRVRRVALKVGPGDEIGPRLGSGQDVCAVYADAPTRDGVAAALSRASELIRFQLS